MIVGVSDPTNYKNSQTNRHNGAYCDIIMSRRFEFLKHRRPTEPVKALEDSTSLGVLEVGCYGRTDGGNA
jgi:hypothetical protein